MKIQIKRAVNCEIHLRNGCNRKKGMIVNDFKEECECKWQCDKKNKLMRMKRNDDRYDVYK